MNRKLLVASLSILPVAFSAAYLIIAPGPLSITALILFSVAAFLNWANCFNSLVSERKEKICPLCAEKVKFVAKIC